MELSGCIKDRIADQMVHIPVPPVMEAIAAAVQEVVSFVPQERVQQRIDEQLVEVRDPPVLEGIREITNVIVAVQFQVRAISKEIQSRYYGKEEFLTKTNDVILRLDECDNKIHALLKQKSVILGQVRGQKLMAEVADLERLVEEWKDCEELKPKLKEKWSFVDRKSEGMKHRTERCAEADRYRCMRCGRGSKNMKMPAKMYWTKILVKKLEKMGRRHLGGHDIVRRRDRQGEVLVWCRKCSGHARQRLGPKLVNRCKPEQTGTKEFGKKMKGIQTLEEGRVPTKKSRQDYKVSGSRNRQPENTWSK